MQTFFLFRVVEAEVESSWDPSQQWLCCDTARAFERLGVGRRVSEVLRNGYEQPRMF